MYAVCNGGAECAALEWQLPAQRQLQPRNQHVRIIAYSGTKVKHFLSKGAEK